MAKNKQELSTQTREERLYLEAAEAYNHAVAKREKWKKAAKDAEAYMEQMYDDLQAARAGQSNLSGFQAGEENEDA